MLNEIGMVWNVPDYLWERNYAAAMEYHKTHGNLEVSSDYVSKDGTRLGAWISNIRLGRKKANHRSDLTEDQIARLDELGMNWDGKYHATWNQSYEAACQYVRDHGDLNIPVAYVSAEGISLGRWIRRQRTAKLSEERKKKLQALGMEWEKTDPWIEKFNLVKSYYDEHGHTRMPNDYVVNGVWLKKWLIEQTARLNEKPTGRNKTIKRLTREQIHKLESVGIRSNRHID